KTINITMSRPSVGAADYPIRMIQRSKRGITGIKTIVYAGFGETEWDEKVIKAINKATELSRRSLSDRLNSTPYDVGVGGVQWGDIEGADAGVDARIVVQNTHPAGTTDIAIDALIATHVSSGHTLNQINNPSGDKEFNFANKHLHFTWVAPAPGAHHGAFELEASGGFSNDLIHIHQHTGNPGESTLVHIEAEDVDALPLKVIAPSTAEDAIELVGGIDNAAFIQFDISNGLAAAEGKLKWNATDGTLEVGMPGGEVNLQIGQEELIRVRNVTGVTIVNGAAVRISGVSGNHPTIDLSDANDPAKAGMIGLATEDIVDDAYGYVTTSGMVRDLNTLAWSVADRLFVSQTPGVLTNVYPSGTDRIIFAGIVIKDSETEGQIWVWPINQAHLAELSGVTIAAPADNDILAYNAGTGTWINQSAAEAAILTQALAYVNAQGLSIATTKLLTFDDGGSVDIIRDEDNMASDDVNALCTQQSIKKFVEDEVAGATDSNAYHDNVADEFDSVAWKPDLVDGDIFIIEDSEAAFVKKALLFSVLKAEIGAGDTKEVSHQYVEDTALTMANDITFNAGQAFDGVDVSAISITNMPTAVNTWKVFYSNADGDIIEVALGADDTFLHSNGVDQIPNFEAVGGGPANLDDLGDVTVGGAANHEILVYDTATSEWVQHTAAEAGLLTSGDNLGNHTATTTLNMNGNTIDNVYRLVANAKIQFSPYNGLTHEWVMDYYSTGTNTQHFQEDATTSAEKGQIGIDATTAKPLLNIYSHDFTIDDGSWSFYSHVDDLQLLREVKAWDVREKAPSLMFPDRKYKVIDMNTLPWIKAHEDVNAMPNDSNEKRYALGVGQMGGYLLSAMKKLLEKVDIMEARIMELEKI
ncbi:hypothetical protein KAR91_29600, partial [Candidatus Pacearchaeota archaeon]|nr:hypothetical protein [Candidatus Pacearchaeota archaeon]